MCVIFSRPSFLVMCLRNLNCLFLILHFSALVLHMFILCYSYNISVAPHFSLASCVFFISKEMLEHSLPYKKIGITMNFNILLFFSNEMFLVFNTFLSIWKTFFLYSNAPLIFVSHFPSSVINSPREISAIRSSQLIVSLFFYLLSGLRDA